MINTTCLKTQLGATMVEYAFMVALIAMVCIAVVTSIGVITEKPFNSAGSSLSSANSG